MKSLFIALAMYSRIPVPKTEWNSKNMKYALCYFPVVGLIIGAVIYLSGYLMLNLQVNKLLFSSVMTVIPVIITGGIHIDGFIDTADALSSYGDREKKLDILKDSHVGAFAVIWTAVYFILSIGIWSEVQINDLKIIVIVYIMSRSLSGLSIVSFNTAKNTGLVAMFADASHKKTVRTVMVLWIILSCSIMIIINMMCGIVLIAAVGIVFYVHYRNCMKNFGGITGDLAGWFLQICEITAVFVTVIFGRLL